MLPRPNKDSRSNNRVISSQMQQCSPHNTPGDAKQQKEGGPCAQTGSGVNAELKGIDLGRVPPADGAAVSSSVPWGL